jgi:hypothetical protein
MVQFLALRSFSSAVGQSLSPGFLPCGPLCGAALSTISCFIRVRDLEVKREKTNKKKVTL